MKKIFTNFLISILKIILFIVILAEKFFEFFKIFAICIGVLAIYLFLKAKGDLKNKTMSDMIVDWIHYHSDSFYIDEIEESFA